jgi:hypothetical protein
MIATKKVIAITALAGTLVGCSRKSEQPIAEQPQNTDPANIVKVDDNHYVVHPLSTDSDRWGFVSTVEFGAALAKFRNEVKGDFIAWPTDARYPRAGDLLMIRREVQSGDGKNTIALGASFGAVDHKGN